MIHLIEWTVLEPERKSGASATFTAQWLVAPPGKTLLGKTGLPRSSHAARRLASMTLFGQGKRAVTTACTASTRVLRTSLRVSAVRTERFSPTTTSCRDCSTASSCFTSSVHRGNSSPVQNAKTCARSWRLHILLADAMFPRRMATRLLIGASTNRCLAIRCAMDGLRCCRNSSKFHRVWRSER